MVTQNNKTKPDKTDWHRLWGLMVSPLFERLGCDVTVEMDLSFKVQRLDMTVFFLYETHSPKKSAGIPLILR